MSIESRIDYRLSMITYPKLGSVSTAVYFGGEGVGAWTGDSLSKSGRRSDDQPIRAFFGHE